MKHLILLTAAAVAAATLTATAAPATAPAAQQQSEAQLVRSLRTGIAWERRRTWHWQHVAGVARSPTIRGAGRYHSPGYFRWIEHRWNRRRLHAYKVAHRPRPTYRTLSSGGGGSLRAFAGPCLATIIDREDTTWDPTRKNPKSGAYGLPQALPGSKMASAGADWATNPYTQIRWMRGYVVGRYGSCAAALAHSDTYGWY